MNRVFPFNMFAFNGLSPLLQRNWHYNVKQMARITMHCSRHQWIKYIKYCLSLECIIPLKSGIIDFGHYGGKSKHFFWVVGLFSYNCPASLKLHFVNQMVLFFFLKGWWDSGYWKRTGEMAKPHRTVFLVIKLLSKKIRYYVWDGQSPWHFAFSKNVLNHFSNILRFGKDLKSILPSTFPLNS